LPHGIISSTVSPDILDTYEKHWLNYLHSSVLDELPVVCFIKTFIVTSNLLLNPSYNYAFRWKSWYLWTRSSNWLVWFFCSL